jgi:hypothetical protein
MMPTWTLLLLARDPALAERLKRDGWKAVEERLSAGHVDTPLEGHPLQATNRRCRTVTCG